MINLIFVQFLTRKLLGQYLEVSDTTNILPDNYILRNAELVFLNSYWFEVEGLPYLTLFKKRLTETQLFVLIVSLPFLEKKEIFDEVMVNEQRLISVLQNLFETTNDVFSQTTCLANLTAKENEYLIFPSSKNSFMAIRLFKRKLYVSSTHVLKTLVFDKAPLVRMDYVIKHYNRIVANNSVFLLSESRVAFIVYNKTESELTQSKAKQIVRRFFVHSLLFLGETILEQNNLFLKCTPSFKENKIQWVKTEEEKDEFEVQNNKHKIAFLFGFKDGLERNPEIRLEGKKLSNGETELKKLVLVGLNVAEFTLEDFNVLRVVTPKFLFEEELTPERIAFLLYCDYSNKSNTFEKLLYKSLVVFYSLSEDELIYKMKLSESEVFFVSLEKVFRDGCLLFEADIQTRYFAAEDFELPSVPDELHPDLYLVYIYLVSTLGKGLNGALIKSETEKDKLKEDGLIPTKPTLFSNKTKGMLVAMFVVLLCLLLFVRFTLRPNKKSGTKTNQKSRKFSRRSC